MTSRACSQSLTALLCEGRRFALMAALAYVLVSLAQAADSGISAVTVYTDRAVVTRSAELVLDKTGVQELSFEGLPAGLVDQSLQVSGKGTARVNILEVSSKTEHLVLTPNERIRALEDELAGLNRQQTVLTDREELLKQQDGYLSMIRAATVQPAPKSGAQPSVEEWGKLLAFNQEQLAVLAKERQGLSVEKETLQAKIDAVTAQLNELRGGGGKTQKRVLVRVEVAAPGTMSLNFKYMIGGAGWWPSHDARLRSDERRVDLSYFGVVRNATGEDWNQVQLTLSTAKPSLGGGAPEFRPWVVDVSRPRPVAMQSAMPAPAMVREEAVGGAMQAKGRAMALADAFDGEVPEERAAGVASAAVESGLSSASFKVALPVTLKADSSTQKVPIATLPLKAELKYEAMPKQRETAYLSAHVTNSSEYPLLAGVLNSFLDDSYVATGRLKTVMAGEAFDLALGADESIAVKRRLVNRFRETVGLTSKTVRVTYEVVVTLTNNRKTTEKIEFTEPLPVSRDERIEVVLLQPGSSEVGTKEAPKMVSREEDGRLVWRLELKPGEKREIPLKYKVEFPTELQLSGLE